MEHYNRLTIDPDIPSEPEKPKVEEQPRVQEEVKKGIVDELVVSDKPKVTEETLSSGPEEKPLTTEELMLELTNVKFLTDPVRFNATIYQGIQIILKKLMELEKEIYRGQTKKQ